MKKSILKLINRWIEKVEMQYGDLSSVKELKLPYHKIGNGDHRIVFDLGDGYVLKVATTLTGIKSGEMEAKIYKMSPNSLKKHLSKVKEYGYGWIVMKKINNKVPITNKYRKKIIKLTEKFIKNRIDPNDIVDKNKKPKWKNIRLNQKGEIIIIDFGHFIPFDDY